MTIAQTYLSLLVTAHPIFDLYSRVRVGMPRRLRAPVSY